MDDVLHTAKHRYVCTQLLAEAAVAETLCSASVAARCGSAFSEVCCNAMLLIGAGQTSLLRMCAWATYVWAFAW